MCDYSLQYVASRPAKVGDKLVTTQFPHADKIAGFSHWLGGLLNDVVLGRDGSWMAPFVGEAGELGRRRAAALVADTVSASLEGAM